MFNSDEEKPVTSGEQEPQTEEEKICQNLVQQLVSQLSRFKENSYIILLPSGLCRQAG